jgi:PBP1b-binding outer membrane lipoprotein LpoB
MSMIRLIPVALISAFLFAGCASPSGNGAPYGSPAQEARMQQDTSTGPGMGSGVNDGQGYKGPATY